MVTPIKQEVQETIRQDSGTHFDPELVEDFMTMQDVVLDIQKRFAG